jgi:DNA gyrase subunit A
MKKEINKMNLNEKDKLFENCQDSGAHDISESIEKTTRDAMIDYGSYIIEDRAIPSVLDGLKPVQRRSIYAMKVDNLIGNKTVKLVKPTGTVMSNYHPHGDSSIISTYVNMAQSFKNNLMVFNPQGNYGSLEDPSAFAAARYIEISMKKPMADLFFQDMDKKGVVSWQDNFDGSTKEPKVLPVKLPFHLINGTTGIAYSMSTRFASFNSQELIKLFNEMIDDKFYSKDFFLSEGLKNKYSSIVPAPDFPTGCNIYFTNDYDKKGVLFNDSFNFRMQASYDIDEENNILTFNHIPYELATDNLKDELINLINPYTEIKGKKILKSPDNVIFSESPYIIPNQKDKNDINIVFHLKKDADIYVELAKILKFTSLDKSFTTNQTVISEKGMPIKISVFDNIKTFLYFRRHVVLNSLLFDISKIDQRLPLLEAFFEIMDKKEDFIHIVSKSEDEDEVFEKVKEKFGFNKEQLDFVLSLQIRRLTKKEVGLREEEFKTLKLEKTKKEEIISSSDNIFSFIKEDYEELLESPTIREKNRSSTVLSSVMSLSKGDLIRDRDIIITLMNDQTIGWSENNIKVKNRGTQTTKVKKKHSDKQVLSVINARLKDELLLITNKGRIFKIFGYDLNSKNVHISNILNLNDNEVVVNIKTITNNKSEIVFVTKNGISSRTQISIFKNASKNRAIIVSKLSDNDEIIFFDIVSETDDMIIVGDKGFGLRFNVDTIRKTNKAGKGVLVYNIKKYGDIKGVTIFDNKSEKTLVLAFENGGIKKMNISELKLQKRNSRGNTIFKNNPEEGSLIGITLLEENKEDLILSTLFGDIAIIKISDLLSVSRKAISIKKGIILKDKDKVVKVSKQNKHFEEENNDFNSLDDVSLGSL